MPEVDVPALSLTISSIVIAIFTFLLDKGFGLSAKIRLLRKNILALSISSAMSNISAKEFVDGFRKNSLAIDSLLKCRANLGYLILLTGFLSLFSIAVSVLAFSYKEFDDPIFVQVQAMTLGLVTLIMIVDWLRRRV